MRSSLLIFHESKIRFRLKCRKYHFLGKTEKRFPKSLTFLTNGRILSAIQFSGGFVYERRKNGYKETFFIKAIDAAAAYFVWRALRLLIAKDSLDILARIPSAIVVEAVMVLGYFLFESALYGVSGGAASLAGNAMQGAFGVVCSVLLVTILYRLKTVRDFFSPLVCAPRAKKQS